jgi:hypothetical protein
MTEALTAWASSPGVYEILTAADDQRVSLLDGEIAAERSRLEVFEVEAIESGSAALARVIRGLEVKISNLEHERHELTVPPVLRDLAEPGADIRARVKSMDLPVLRRVISTVADPVLSVPEPGQPVDSPYRLVPNFRDDPRSTAAASRVLSCWDARVILVPSSGPRVVGGRPDRRGVHDRLFAGADGAAGGGPGVASRVMPG